MLELIGKLLSVISVMRLDSSCIVAAEVGKSDARICLIELNDRGRYDTECNVVRTGGIAERKLCVKSIKPIVGATAPEKAFDSLLFDKSRFEMSVKKGTLGIRIKRLEEMSKSRRDAAYGRVAMLKTLAFDIRLLVNNKAVKLLV
jgi:hypothetical protein